MEWINIDLSRCTASVKNCESYYLTGCGYDTESTTIKHEEIDNDIKRTVIDSCFVYHIQFAIDEQYFSFRTFRDFCTWFDELLKTVKNDSVSRETKPKLLIWVANLSHEWAFMKNYFISRYKITKCFAKGHRDVLLVEIDECIQFREAIGLFGHSLADIAKNWCKKYKKLVGDLQYDLCRTFETPIKKRERAYMENDVFILTEMHHAVFNAYTRDNGVIYIPYTVAGFVRLNLKKAIEENEDLTETRESLGGKWLEKSNVQLLKKRNQKLFTTADDWNILREYGFAGGGVGSNIAHVGKVKKHVKCADITSDYPYQMLLKKFPNGPIKRGTLSDLQMCERDKLPYFTLIHVDEIRAKTQHALLSEHKIVNHKKYGTTEYIQRHGTPKNMIVYNGKIKLAQNVVLVWSDIDRATYENAYDIKGFHMLKLWYFPWGYRRLPDWFVDCIVKAYITKAKLKVSGQKNTVEYNDAKRDVNTGFGVLASRQEDIYNSLDYLSWFVPKKEFQFQDMVRNTWLNPYWAFYVTSYARQMLFQYIVKYPDCIMQYDTDSLYFIANKQGEQLEKEILTFNQQCVENNKRRFKNIPDNEFIFDLGTWDFDDEYDNFLCMGAKKYIKQHGDAIETVIAGLPKAAIPKEIKRYHVKHIFERFNPILQDCDITIRHMFAHKFASVYNDQTHEEYQLITDYQNHTSLQPVTSFHALAPIDFTLGVADDYMKQIRAYQKIKPLK